MPWALHPTQNPQPPLELESLHCTSQMIFAGPWKFKRKDLLGLAGNEEIRYSGLNHRGLVFPVLLANREYEEQWIDSTQTNASNSTLN